MERITKYEFRSKARTLLYLQTRLKSCHILPVIIIKKDDLLSNSDIVFERIQETIKEDKIIIRSSSKNEDTALSSNAGKFESYLNVNKKDKKDVLEKIGKVIQSYNSDDNEEVLVQPMLNNCIVSGVVFTCDLETYSPYYIVNYDIGMDTASVTSGSTNNLKTYIHYKDSPFEPEEQFIKNLLITCKEIEKITQNSFLDIEFGVDQNNSIYIFQVRPIVINTDKDLSHLKIDEPLKKIYKKILKLNAKHPNLLGDKTIFGVMPDWNPAEIIGLRPKKLAVSLYKELITNKTWAYQRDNYGYRNLRSHPLMISLLGVPFIDVRVSFNSFVPKDLNEKTAEKLINYYLKKLSKNPHYHDKVEFEIVYSCYYLNLSQRLTELEKEGFTKQEIKEIELSLLRLTNNIIRPEGIYKKDIDKADVLEKRYNQILNSDLSIVDKIYWLTEECKRYGTLPFAGAARGAFIGMQFLRSFLELNIISKNDYDSFLNSIKTINKEMSIDIKNYYNKKMSYKDFLSKYGHIRPGTYNILSPRYDEHFELYFSFNNIPKVESVEFQFSSEQKRLIEMKLKENNITCSPDELIKYIRETIEGREYLKFIFTKTLSQVLLLVEEFGRRFDITKEDLAYLDIKRILELYSTLDHRDVKDIFIPDIQKNKEFHQYTRMVRFPSIIIEPKNIYHHYLLEEEPNFITLKNITAEVIRESEISSKSIENKIVMIESADPGYDFLFTKNIGGLITQFGGTNSHMAIRCAELGIPAVIGAGELNFKKWSKKMILELDCMNKQVRFNR